MAPPTSLATARRQQDGLRRVSFSETRMTSSRLYDSDDSIDERLREEEEEKALSERHGEAEDDETATTADQGRKRKMDESEKDIAQELDQEEKKKIKKPRPQLLPAHLTNENGLIKLPIEMKRIKYKPRKGKKRDVPAAASYCQNLVTAYQAFCDDLFPSMNFEDVLLKIEQLGSKKEVKTFLENMRNNTRNEHLERLYGRETAERMLQELEDGLKQQQLPHDDEEGDYGDYYSEPMKQTDSSSAVAVTPGRDSPINNTDTPTASTETEEPTQQVSPPKSTLATESNRRAIESDEEEQEGEANFDEEMGAAEAEAKFDEEMEAAAAAAESTTKQQVTEPSSKSGPSTETKDKDPDSDEEVEATFDEEEVIPTKENQPVAADKTNEDSSESQPEVVNNGEEMALDSSKKTTDVSTSDGDDLEPGGGNEAAAKDSTSAHGNVEISNFTEGQEQQSVDQPIISKDADEKESAATQDDNSPE